MWKLIIISRSHENPAFFAVQNVIFSRLGKINSVAVVEDTGGFSGVLTTAHEIAHVLGVVHDGDYAPSYLSGK